MLESKESLPQVRGLDPRLRRLIAVISLGPFMTHMDTTIVNVSLSTIREELHTSITVAHWVVSGYLLALALMLPLNGWLVDRLGVKRLYLLCFSSFTAASLVCGAARTIHELIFARIFQGIAGGLLAPMTSMMIARVAGKKMARAMGYTAVPVILAPLLGPALAGIILQRLPWPWLFYVNFPIGLVAVILAAHLIPNDVEMREKKKLDLIGFCLLSPGLACLLYGLEEMAHRKGAFSVWLGLGLLGAFGIHAQKKRSDALIDFKLFHDSVFLSATRTQFLSNGVIYAGQFLIPLYLTQGCGFTPSQTGLLLAPMGLGMLVSYPIVGSLTERWGYRAVSSSGIFISFLGTIPFLWMSRAAFCPKLATACLILRGMGQGATGIPSSSAAFASVPRDQLGVGTTVINIVQKLGGPVLTTGMAIVVSLSPIIPASGNVAQSFVMPFAFLILIQLLIFCSARQLPNHILESR